MLSRWKANHWNRGYNSRIHLNCSIVLMKLELQPTSGLGAYLALSCCLTLLCKPCLFCLCFVFVYVHSCCGHNWRYKRCIVHTDKYFLNLVKSNQIWIIITLFQLIWNQMKFRWVPNQTEHGTKQDSEKISQFVTDTNKKIIFWEWKVM